MIYPETSLVIFPPKQIFLREDFLSLKYLGEVLKERGPESDSSSKCTVLTPDPPLTGLLRGNPNRLRNEMLFFFLVSSSLAWRTIFKLAFPVLSQEPWQLCKPLLKTCNLSHIHSPLLPRHITWRHRSIKWCNKDKNKPKQLLDMGFLFKRTAKKRETFAFDKDFKFSNLTRISSSPSHVGCIQLNSTHSLSCIFSLHKALFQTITRCNYFFGAACSSCHATPICWHQLQQSFKSNLGNFFLIL